MRKPKAKKKRGFFRTALFFIATAHFLLCPAPLRAEGAEPQYPRIVSTETSRRNVVLRQYLDDVAANYKALASSAYDRLSFSFYTYTATGSDSLVRLASRFSIPQESIALLNHLPHADTSLNGKTLVIPSVAGLYIPAEPQTFVEQLLSARFENGETLVPVVAGTERFFLAPNGRLTGTERLYFLDSRLQSPLEQSVLSSEFGPRISPITGKEKFHNGLDLAAPAGTPVYACTAGTVSFCGSDSVFGNYVILDHDNSLQSLYAHLQKFTVKKGDRLTNGKLLGYVGTTGLTTGPHLHFELHKDGVPLNPEALLH